jgi:gamma-butyrobetaine dioxygenase
VSFQAIHDNVEKLARRSPLDDIPLMSDTDTRRYHRARKRLGLLFEDPAFELRFKLEPGQLMIFDNNRVLHGRTSFDPSEGHRQLQGCYIDRDGPRSLYRVLRRRLASPPASVTTPTPELSHADS